MKKVSVIIPTIKGREEVLQRARKSAENQTHKDTEIIIQRKGENAPDARNRAALSSKGEYLAFLDDDDEFLPDKLRKQSEYLDLHPSVGLVATWIEDNRFNQQYIDKYPESLSTLDILKMLRFSSTSSYMIRKSLFDKIGGFDTNLPSAQEYDLAIRASEYLELACLQEVLVRQHKSQNQITKDSKKKVKGLQMIYNKHYKQSRYKNHIPYSVSLKFQMAIIMYKLQPYLGSTIERLVVKYKTR